MKDFLKKIKILELKIWGFWSKFKRSKMTLSNIKIKTWFLFKKTKNSEQSTIKFRRCLPPVRKEFLSARDNRLFHKTKNKPNKTTSLWVKLPFNSINLDTSNIFCKIITNCLAETPSIKELKFSLKLEQEKSRVQSTFKNKMLSFSLPKLCSWTKMVTIILTVKSSSLKNGVDLSKTLITSSKEPVKVTVKSSSYLKEIESWTSLWKKSEYLDTRSRINDERSLEIKFI